MNDNEAIATVARIVAQRDPSADPVPSNPELAARIAELREECGLELRVLKAQPDAVVVLVTNGDPAPFFMSILADKTLH